MGRKPLFDKALGPRLTVRLAERHADALRNWCEARGLPDPPSAVRSLAELSVDLLELSPDSLRELAERRERGAHAIAQNGGRAKGIAGEATALRRLAARLDVAKPVDPPASKRARATA